MSTTDKKPWGVVFADIAQGHAVTESGIKFCFAPGASLYNFLKEAHQHTPVNRVFLCGERPGSYIDWLTSPEMYKHWRTQSIGHVLEGNDPDNYVGRYEHKITGKRLDIRSIERWLSTTDCSVFEARSALLLITQYLKGQFPLFRHLSGTPSTTFGVLWQQYNSLEKKRFEPLAEEIRELIRESTGQGRIEYFEENTASYAPGLWYYDGIFMYAGLAWGLPTEVETHDTRDEYAGKQFARYRIEFRVPFEWNHIGPFGVKDEDGIWIYPGANYKGFYFDTWVDGAELDALVSVYKERSENAFDAWNIIIKERIIYKNPKDCAVKNPLDGTIKRLVALRNKIEEDARQDIKHATAYKLARAGFRNMALHGIGAFNRQSGTRTYLALPSEVPPAGFTDRTELDDGRIAYILPEESEPDAMSHPEYPACIWGRCRARIFKHVVGTLKYEDLVTIRTDAIATRKRVHAWEAGKKVGELREKWAIDKRTKLPATAAEFDELQRKILAKGSK